MYHCAVKPRMLNIRGFLVSFSARIKKQGLDENSPEYKDLYVSTYGPLKPK